jgi:prolipoprotein diacylglyceryltransferase
MIIHTLFDILAWLSATLMALFASRRGWLQAGARVRTPFRDPGYFAALGLGAIAGALALGSLNLAIAGRFEVGHSIAGAIAGGIVAVEIFKLAHGIRESTGGQFVAPLAVGIAVGRLGCFFSGLPDYTYGTPTSLPWGADFGDGIPRHPVQLYESLSMLAFAAIWLIGISSGSRFLLRQGFYIFVGWYGAQRFLWEFLKPYPTLIGPLNVFHLTCAVLVCYSLYMIRRSIHDPRPAVQEL